MTPLRRHVPRAVVTIHMQRYWSQSLFKRLDYPAKKTARRSNARFKRYKLLKSVTVGPGRAAQYEKFPLVDDELARPSASLVIIRHVWYMAKNTTGISFLLFHPVALSSRSFIHSIKLSLIIASHSLIPSDLNTVII